MSPFFLCYIDEYLTISNRFFNLPEIFQIINNICSVNTIPVTLHYLFFTKESAFFLLIKPKQLFLH